MSEAPLVSPTPLPILCVTELKIICGPKSINGERTQAQFALNISPQVHPIIHQKVSPLKEGETCEFEVKSDILRSLFDFDSKFFDHHEDLKLSVELKNRFEFIDLSPENDKTILASIIDKNDSWDTPTDLCKVSVKYKIFDQYGVIIEDRNSSLNPLQIKLDEKQAPEGLEIIIKHMTTSSWGYAILRGKYAFRPLENCDFIQLEDLNQSIHIQGIILNEHKRLREACELNFEEKKLRGHRMLLQGNKWFKLKDYPRAARRYKMGIDALEYLGGKSTEEDRLSCKECLTQLRLNSSNSFINQEKYIEAMKFADDVLSQDDQNYKAYLHKITALLKLDRYFHAENLCNKCVINFPDQNKFRELQKKINKTYENDKSIKKMYEAFWK